MKEFCSVTPFTFSQTGIWCILASKWECTVLICVICSEFSELEIRVLMWHIVRFYLDDRGVGVNLLIRIVRCNTKVN